MFLCFKFFCLFCLSMTYEEQLIHPKWRQFRDLILERDKYACRNCDNLKRFDNCRTGIFNKDPDAGRIHNKEIILFVDPNIEAHELYYACYIIGPPNILIGLKGITAKEGDYLEAKKQVDPIKWLKEDKIHQLRVKGSCKNRLMHDQYTTYVSTLDSLQWLYLAELHVHHKYYQMGKYAWEYPTNALETLCWNCHREKHENSTITVYDETFKPVTKYTVCPRCHGAGWFPQWYDIEEGICFYCRGAKYLEVMRMKQ